MNKIARSLNQQLISAPMYKTDEQRSFFNATFMYKVNLIDICNNGFYMYRQLL